MNQLLAEYTIDFIKVVTVFVIYLDEINSALVRKLDENIFLIKEKDFFLF